MSEKLFDPIRGKYVVLTPEEWVRQQLIHYLLHELDYPRSLCSVEKNIRVGNRTRRYDIVVYNAATPWMVIECKSETTKLTDAVLQQVLSYTSTMPVKYLVVCNGKLLYCYDIEDQTWSSQLPPHPSKK